MILLSSMSIPDSFNGSPALQFIQSRGWNWKVSTIPNVELETCPYCQKTGYGHLYIEIHGLLDETPKRDGLHLCHKCGKGGSLYDLKVHEKAIIPGVQSRQDWAGEKAIEPLPDIDAAHQALLEDSDALDYLMNTRGFSKEIIEKTKLGIVPKKYFKECGEVKALVYPYLVNGNCVFVHYRTLPPSPKSFTSPKGWDVPLFNGEVLKDGLKEIVLVEGEANVIAAMDKGYTNICGVPGANVKKAEWIETLDKLELEKVYICYDKDKVGNKAAQALASRIGVQKCWKVMLPDFEVTIDSGETRKGKDLNEYFVNGGTPESFKELLNSAILFDVDGVTGPQDALQELEDLINGRGLVPQYTTPWPSLNRLVGFDEGDIIDIIAPAKIGKTTFALNLLEHMCNTYGEDGIIICLEMTTVKLARKWVAHVAGIEDNIPKNPEDAERLKSDFINGIKFARNKVANRDGDLYFCYPHYKKMDDLYKLIIDIIRRYGVKWIVFDNVQRACDTTVGSKNRTQHMSEISKVLSQIGKDYLVQVVRIVQPHQIKQGQLTQAEDADGSSQISKDCDATITLDRIKLNKISENDFEQLGFVESEAAFGPKMLASVGLSRYSGGGYTTLHYDGARSSIYEYDAVAIAQFKQESSVGYDKKFAELTKVEEKQDIQI